MTQKPTELLIHQVSGVRPEVCVDTNRRKLLQVGSIMHSPSQTVNTIMSAASLRPESLWMLWVESRRISNVLVPAMLPTPPKISQYWKTWKPPRANEPARLRLPFKGVDWFRKREGQQYATLVIV